MTRTNQLVMRSTSLILMATLCVERSTQTALALVPSTQPVVALAPATQPAAEPDKRFVVVMGSTTQPALAQAPATQPSVASLLSAIDSAYSKLTSAEFDGHIVGNFDAEGQQNSYDVPFTSSFSTPNKFRHDAVGDVLLGSTGTTVYSFLGQRDEYQSFDAPKGRAAEADWPPSATRILADQNPSLLLAISKSAAAELNGLSKQITLEPATVIDGVSYDTLRFDSSDGQIITMLIDPATHLLHQVQFDKRKSLEKDGASDVKQAMVTIFYTRAAADAPLTAEQFAWTPPAGAMQASSTVAMADAGDGLGDELKALIGKPAPNFTLTGLDDSSVTLSAQKGSVVVLDFWATWCGPCVASLPHLNSLYQQQAPNGLKMFALNQKELKKPVSSFVQKKGWTIPVLLDSDGAVAGSYKVTGIPQTVIVGKDGTVKQIYVGSGHEKEIVAQVAKEMQ